ncbi:MAG TPA: hypothetical protein VLK65_03430 [Vicinamibacteria bacterium]|nr:hypothetical protein [Vicinamibacteria bacterium]
MSLAGYAPLPSPADGLDSGDAGILACCGSPAIPALRKIVRRDGPIGILGMGGLGLMALAIAKGTGLVRLWRWTSIRRS